MSQNQSGSSEPAESTPIADRLVANKARAIDLMHAHRDHLRKVHSVTSALQAKSEAADLSTLREELEQKQQRWLEIQDRVCQQHEEFLLEVQRADRPLEEGDGAQKLRHELEEWKAKCEELQQQADAANASMNAMSEHEDMLKHAEALAEIHDLRAANAQLRSQLEEFEQQSKSAAPPQHGGFDWEEHKRRMLNELEGGAAPEPPSETPAPQPVVDSSPNQILIEQEEEIERLKTTIQEQADKIAELEHALEQSSDKDEIDRHVREERNKLSTMQDEWREMLRLAEVEISVERAKLARDQRKLEEQASQYKNEIKRLEQNVANLEAGNSSSQGNWLTRLGLGGGNK